MATVALSTDTPTPASHPAVAAVDAYRASPGDTAAADRYLAAVKPWMGAAVRAYAGPQAGPAVHAKAKQMALDAALTYDPEKGALSTHLHGRWQGLRRFAARTDNPVRVPERQALDAARVRRAEDELRLDLGRDPSDAEVSDRARVPLGRLAAARGNGGRFLPESAAPDGYGLVAAGPTKAAREAWVRYVYHDLTPVDQLVLEHSIGLNGRAVLNTTQLAAKLGVTPGAVSQRKTRIESLLNEYEGLGLGLGG